MNGSIREFSTEIEGKLDRAYSAMGGIRKYGYDANKGEDIGKLIENDRMMGGLGGGSGGMGASMGGASERNLAKMIKQANSFLGKNDTPSTNALPAIDGDRLPRIGSRSGMSTSDLMKQVGQPARRPSATRRLGSSTGRVGSAGRRSSGNLF